MRSALLALLVLVAGCRPSTGPKDTLDAYLSAVQASNIDQAYALMSGEYRKTHDRAAFARALATVDKNAAARLRKGRVTLEATVDVGDGETLPLVFENGEWRVARDPLDFYPQATPAEALRSFIRAVENHRYDVVLKFVPARYRTTITVDKLRDRWEGERRVELAAQLALARAHLTEPFAYAPSGEEATLPLSAGPLPQDRGAEGPVSGAKKQVRLVREDGAWKIESID
jgi:hypothetical protein